MIATQAPSFDSRFRKLDPGDDVTGSIEASRPIITLDECIVRYMENNMYFWISEFIDWTKIQLNCSFL